MKSRTTLIAAALLAPSLVQANGYPTQDRVEYVLQCMSAHGGQSYDTLYPCICAIDFIAERMNFEQYTDAQTFSVMVNTPGERGGAFRDAPGARQLVKTFQALREEAETKCFVKARGQ